MALDQSDDQFIFDDPVTVSYRVRPSEAVLNPAVTVPFVQKNKLSKEDYETNSSWLGKKMTVFHLWRAQLGSIVPKVTDIIIHGSIWWKAESVEEMDRDALGPTRYRVVALQIKALS